MRKLDVSALSISNGMPLKSGPFTHLQLAYQEAIAQAIIGWIGSTYDATKVYRLSGVANTGSGSNYIISAGAVFFNGEVYLVDAATFSISGSNVAEGTITITYFSGVEADPQDFTDGVPRNIHQIRKIVYGAALSGSGAGDFTDLEDINTNIAQVALTGDGVTGTYPNYTIPGAGTLIAVASGTFHLGDGAPTQTTITIGSTLPSSTYFVMGTIVSNGTLGTDATILWAIKSRSTTTFIVGFTESVSGTQDVNWEWVIFQAP